MSIIPEDYERVWAQEMNWLGAEKEWEERKLWDEIKDELGMVREAEATKRIRLINIKGSYVRKRNNRRGGGRAK